jgi:hypothetical protein
MKYDLMTKLGDLLKDPQAMEIIEKYVPGLAKNPLIRLVKGKAWSHSLISHRQRMPV